MATDNQQLSTHLSIHTDRHFGFVLDLRQKAKFIRQIRSGSGLSMDSPPFEPRNTKLPDVLSLTPYVKISSMNRIGVQIQRLITTPLVHQLASLRYDTSNIGTRSNVKGLI